MDNCFVIQPFDKNKFDKRYKDVFEPAIKAAGLEPYRVDRDLSVRIPIEQIEDGIKNARICFAEITSDNPNIWYELGYAFALDKDVVMVTEERTKFPFDIQHKHIITYETNSSSDFLKLEHDITNKLKAFLQKRENVQRIIENPIKENEGLSVHEMTMILVTFENQVTETDTVPANRLYRDMESVGFNKLASNVAIRLLRQKGYLDQKKEFSEFDGESYTAFLLTPKAEQWVLENQDKIEMKKTFNGDASKLIGNL